MDFLNVYLVTFNCGRVLIDVDRFASFFFTHRSSSLPPPDLIVLSLQEVAPLAHSFLGGSLLTPYFRRFIEAVNKASSDHYESIAARNIGLTAIIVLSRQDKSSIIRPHSFAGVGVGWYQMGNKGAVGVRLTVGDQSLANVTFVSAHLAPMEDAVMRRNQDWRDILSGLVFTAPHPRKGPEDSETQPLLAAADDSSSAGREASMFEKHHPVFFAGDLNYRTSDIGPPAAGHKVFPRPLEADEPSYQAWYEKDQLTRERSSHSTLHHLEENPVRFPPTYKYHPDVDMNWPRDGSEPATYHWAMHRYPSWCDRILFSSQLAHDGSPLTTHSYAALPLQPTSDHRPVALSFSLDLKPFSTGLDGIEGDKAFVAKKTQWAAHRATARRLELLVGAAAYLTLTSEGTLLLLATIVGALGGWLMLRSLIDS